MSMTEPTFRLFAWSLEVSEGEAASLIALLSPDERARAHRFVKPESAHHFIAARAGLRMIIGMATGVMPGDVAFDLSAHGKPRLAGNGDMHFNLSHSGGHAVLVLSHQGPVGIDVERIRELSSGIESQFLSALEVLQLARVSSDERVAVLVRLWAAKEAVIKLHGDHRQLRPDDIHLGFDETGQVATARIDGEAACQLISLGTMPGFACVLAHPGPCNAPEILVTHWQGLRASGA